MPLIPVAPPQPVAIYSSFDYMTADAERRRVYAAHTLNRSILIVNGGNGNVLGRVGVGAMHGVIGRAEGRSRAGIERLAESQAGAVPAQRDDVGRRARKPRELRLDPERARIAAAKAEARARELGTEELCWELPGGCDDAIAAALVEGTILHAYRFERHSPGAERRPLARLLVSAERGLSAAVKEAALLTTAQNSARDLAVHTKTLSEDAPTMLARFSTPGNVRQPAHVRHWLPVPGPWPRIAVADTPPDILEAIARGVDLFDCVIPTSLAWQSTAFTSTGRVRLDRTAHRLTDGAGIAEYADLRGDERAFDVHALVARHLTDSVVE